MNWDLEIAREGKQEINAFPIYTDFYYNDLVYDPFKLDITSAALNFTHMAVDGDAVIYLEMPLIKSWKIMFDYYYKFLFMSHRGSMEIDLVNT